MISYSVSPNDHTSLAAPVCSEPTMVPGWRIPCSRKTGQNTPNWNQRTISSRNDGEVMSPSLNPPMSVVHHGMPDRPMFSPAGICRRRSSKVESMSPDQTSAPYRWLPAQADRHSSTISCSPSARMPS